MLRTAGVLICSTVLVVSAIAGPTAAHGHGGVTVTKLTADAEANPLGVDAARPRLAWQLLAHERGQRQTAYEVVVATSTGNPVWSTGKVASAESTGIPYGGPALRPATRYFWQVRVWDGDGRPSPWSRTAWWETGLLSEGDWAGADWIGGPSSLRPIGLEGASWIWFPEGDPAQSAPPGTRWLRKTFTLPAGAITGARIAITADDRYDLHVNGHRVASGDSWQQARVVDLSAVVREGSNTLAVEARNATETPAGLVAKLRIDRAGADPVEVVTDGSWRASDDAPSGWQRPEFDDSAWPAALVAAPYGQGPWGNVAVGDATPGPLLRKKFKTTKRVERARAYVSGLGYYVMSIDGRRVGDSVLDPGATVYDKTALYATYDVTSALRRSGDHAVGVALGRGFYGLPRGDTKWWGAAPWLGDPRLRLALVVDYADGTSDTVLSDSTWQTTSGPTVRDSVYLGETYDARLARPGWDTPGFDPSGWEPASVVEAPTANLRSQRMEPIRIVDTLRADRVTQPAPGRYVFRFPVVTAGWARLRVKGSAGTEVTLRYGETLRPDGTVNNDGDPGLTNGPVQTDRYILRGAGTETWEPSFSYKGFQYVQVDGYPGRPSADDVVARVVHSDVPSAGGFRSSDGLLNTIHTMTRRTILNNLHSVFTDTPMFEKRGWLGDANVLVPTTIDNFGMRRFYRNWMLSIVDNQGPDGAGVEVAPNPYGAGYTDPIWGGAIVSIPWELYQEYGDQEVLLAGYDEMVAYVNHLEAHSEGLIQRGFYGDWVSPATSGTFPWPPEGARLTATAYFHRYASQVARAATVLGRADDAARFGALADRVRDAFNARFLDRDRGIYRTDVEVGYRQTSNAVPLRFGLVPEEYAGRVTQNLVADIRARGNHLNTGHAGTKELLPALTENGHVDTAFAVATQRTYPSWGFWIDNGATTLWEAWETTTRSRDHAFLGSVDDWFYRDLAGIRPAAPGYERVTIRPHLPAGLGHAAATMDTVRGTVASEWRRTPDGTLHLNVTIPVNASAEVAVPASSADDVREGASPAAKADGVRFLRMDGDRAVFEVGSGSYRFRV